MTQITRRIGFRGIALGGAVALSAVALLGVSSAFAVTPTAESASPTLEVYDSTMADFGIAALVNTQARGSAGEPLPDELDPAILGSVDGIDTDTVQYLGASDDNQYWAAIDTTGRLCLIGFIPGKEWLAGSACSDPKTFKQWGAGLRLVGPEGDLEAYLVPDVDQVPDETLASVGASNITANLFVVSNEVDRAQRDVLTKELLAQGIEFGLFPDSYEESNEAMKPAAGEANR